MFWIVSGIVVIAGLFLTGIYNFLIALRNQIKDGWSQVEVQLNRRYDLVPRVVEAAKSYMRDEEAFLDEVDRTRTMAMSAGCADARVRAEEELESAICRFLEAVERYPVLKNNRGFLDARADLRSAEAKIAHACRSYNERVLLYNNRLRMFPSSWVAAVSGFSKAEYFRLFAGD